MTDKNKLPYYKRYPRDFLEGTLGMPFELKAAYGLILDLIYIHGTELPDDQRFIAGQLNVSVRKWNSIRSELIKIDKIQIISGFISNYRAVIELESLSKYQEKQAENATKSNNNRHLQKPPHKPKYSQPEPEPEPKKRDTNVSHKNGTSQLQIMDKDKNISSEFETIWLHYRKIKQAGKKDAKAAYIAARKKVSHEAITKPLGEYMQHRDGQDHKYTVHLSRWLQKERWTDNQEHAANARETSDSQLDGLMSSTDVQLDNLFPEAKRITQ